MTVDVAVDPGSSNPYGTATYHSKDQDGGITGLLEPLLTAVRDIAAVVSGNEWALALASVVNAGESAQNFAEGNVLAGVLDLGAAAGFGAQSVGAFAQNEGVAAGAQGVALAGYPTILSGTAAATSLTGQYILEATALVGGLSGIVNSAENGDGVGVVAGSLEAAAAVASGLATAAGSATDGPNGLPSDSNAEDAAILNNVSTALAIVGGATAGADEIEHGHVADGLLASLGPLFASISANYQSISDLTLSQTDSVADYQPNQQYAQANTTISDVPLNVAVDITKPLVGGTASFNGLNNGVNGVVSAKIIAVSPGGLFVNLTSNNFVANSAVINVTPPGGATVAAVTVAGLANEVAVLNASATSLRAVSIPAALIPDVGEVAPPILQTSAALLNAYALHMSLQTVSYGTIAGANLEYTKDTKTDILTLRHLNSAGTPLGDFVQLAITASGSLETADGETAGQINADGGFTISPLFQAEYAAGNVGYVADTATVYEISRLRAALGAPPPGLLNPEANHITPQGGPQSGGRNPSPAQNTLSVCNVSLDSASNGVYLSRAFHAKIHTYAYYNMVNVRLAGITSNARCVEVLDQIAAQLVQDDAIFTASGGTILPAFAP